MRILNADIHLIDLQTRFPFKYGIATMTRAPHAFVRVRVESSGGTATGIAADVLPPKWFTKVPEKPPGDEIDEMLLVVQRAVENAPGIEGPTAFDLWRQLYLLQSEWGRLQGMPPLLTNFGTTLVERAVIEAACKLQGTTFADALRGNLLGVRLGEMDASLEGFQPGDLLPPTPRERIIARHTIGMADALTEDEIPADGRLGDGLPQSLEACIQRYGLRHFKIKISGDLQRDIERINRIARVIEKASRRRQTREVYPEAHASGSPGEAHASGSPAPAGFAFTLDGNEQFRTLEEFRQFWRKLTAAEGLWAFFEHLLFVEQPFHRDVALDPGVLAGLRDWHDRPPLIIDESDAEPDSMRRALKLGYHGTSHKNCKGIFKSILNACLLASRRSQVAGGHPEADASGSPGEADASGSPLIMSGEDLANVGPVALLQDLAAAAALGIESVERNGHHYFAGLSMFPPAVREQVLRHHGDLYRASQAGWPTLAIRDGILELGSVNRSPFGVGFDLDAGAFATVEQWRGRVP